jgi:hypothetical protein
MGCQNHNSGSSYSLNYNKEWARPVVMDTPSLLAGGDQPQPSGDYFAYKDFKRCDLQFFKRYRFTLAHMG